jgi:hypothetical protein
MTPADRHTHAAHVKAPIMPSTVENLPAFGCVKNTIRLRSGRYFDFTDPQTGQFTFSDIAGALAKICRFGGQVDRFYSVAEHSVHCAQVARDDGRSKDVQFAILMHDAAEAFCGDVVKPLKIMLPQYSEIERRVELVIASKFGIDFASHADVIREIDWAMLIAERRSMFSADDVTWHGENEVRRLVVSFRAFGPIAAEEWFVSESGRCGFDRRGHARSERERRMNPTAKE